MKKPISIFLIVILVLNAMGYYGLFVGMHYENDLAMRKALDADTYDQSQSVTIKVAVSVPYMPDQPAFERVDGVLEHQGEYYRLVKQRYAKDTLTIICVRDTEHKKINQGLADYVKSFTDNPVDSKAASKSTSSFLKDYLATPFSIRSLSNGWLANVVRNPVEPTFISTYSVSILHPPERV